MYLLYLFILCVLDQRTDQSHFRVEQNNDKSLQVNNNGAEPNEIIPIQGMIGLYYLMGRLDRPNSKSEHNSMNKISMII